MPEEQRRVGVLIPSPNTVFERDLAGRLPRQVTAHVARMWVDESDKTGAAMLRMLDEGLEMAVKQIASVRPHVVLFACTDAGALSGAEAEAAMCAAIGKVAGAPAISLMEEVRRSLVARNAKRVAILTPYNEEKSLAIARGLEYGGLEVTACHWNTAPTGFAIGLQTPEAIAAFAERTLKGLAMDCCLLSCANWRAAEAAGEIERALGVPVVTSTLAGIEGILRELGLPVLTAA